MRKPHANHVNCVAAYLCSFVKLYTRHKTVALLCFSQSFGKPKGNELFSSPAQLNCSPCPWWSLPFCHLTGVFAIKCTSETYSNFIKRIIFFGESSGIQKVIYIRPICFVRGMCQEIPILYQNSIYRALACLQKHV